MTKFLSRLPNKAQENLMILPRDQSLRGWLTNLAQLKALVLRSTHRENLSCLKDGMPDRNLGSQTVAWPHH